MIRTAIIAIFTATAAQAYGDAAYHPDRTCNTPLRQDFFVPCQSQPLQKRMEAQIIRTQCVQWLAYRIDGAANHLAQHMDEGDYERKFRQLDLRFKAAQRFANAHVDQDIYEAVDWRDLDNPDETCHAFTDPFRLGAASQLK